MRDAETLARRLSSEMSRWLSIPKDAPESLSETMQAISAETIRKVRRKALEAYLLAFGGGLAPWRASTKAWEACYGIGKAHCDASEGSFRRHEIREEMGTSDFFLCSWHGDCAKDHLTAQGKLYIGTQPSEEATSYAEAEKIGTLWEVVFLSPYLLTRPHCRHYVVPVTLDMAKEGADTLLDRLGMRTEKGNRRLATQRFYDAEAAIVFYEARLSMHRAMARKTGDMRVQAAVLKDAILLRSWKKRRERLS